jgi:transposase-like protein
MSTPRISDEGMSPAVPLEAVTDPTKRTNRRRFTDEYKLRVLEEIDACTEPGQISALLRREKLYSSYLVEWRQMRARGELGPRPPAIRSNPTSDDPSLYERLAEVESENRQLHERLRQAELILDIQEKTLKLFGVHLKPRIDEEDPKSTRARA